MPAPHCTALDRFLHQEAGEQCQAGGGGGRGHQADDGRAASQKYFELGATHPEVGREGGGGTPVPVPCQRGRAVHASTRCWALKLFLHVGINVNPRGHSFKKETELY